MNFMPSPLDREPMDRSIMLPVNCSTGAAEDLHVRLVLAADLDGEIRIDGSQVESIGQAVLQLLLVARREASVAGLDFAIHSPSVPLVQRVLACGLGTQLGLQPTEQNS